MKLGDRAKDRISGLTGIIVGTTEWLYGCKRIGLQPEKLGKDGKTQDTAWFDEGQIVVTKQRVITVEPIPAATGGPKRGEETK